MVDVATTIAKITGAKSWNQRIAQIRLVPQNHGTGDHARIFAQVAREVYVPHLAPDFAYIHASPFYEENYFNDVYASVESATSFFQETTEEQLAAVIEANPRALLVFRTIMGLTNEEFAHSTGIAAESMSLRPISANKVDSMERNGTLTSADQAKLVARTLTAIIDGSLFGEPVDGLKRKQEKPDTQSGWESVRGYASSGVPYATFLHQRHYGGAFRQVLDATSGHRGSLIEDAVESLFVTNGVPYIRTGSHNQGDIAERFEVQIAPAPDFVVFDGAERLQAMLECKVTNNGGTARDKALRFERLRAECIRLGGIPLFAVLGGVGWARVNDTLGPVVRYTDGRVFTLATLPEMMTIAPFSSLVG